MACSDGLWHYFKPEEFGAKTAELPASEAVQVLVNAARVRARGGGDNVSIALLKVELPVGAAPAPVLSRLYA